MITGRLTYNDQSLLVIGLTERNLSDLKAGKPIALDGERCPTVLGDNAGIFLFSGDTEELLIQHLREIGIGIGTVIDARTVPANIARQEDD